MADADTRAKRTSGLAELPWEWGDSVVVSGTIDVLEREASVTTYNGITPSAAVAFTPRLPLLGVG